ncbi:MAG: hypothetical protein ACOC3F_01800 [Desulfosudaceae bacterium]
MKVKSAARNLLLLAVLLVVAACSTVPITGRSQVTLISQSAMLAMSFQQYDEFLSSHPTIENSTQARLVKKVGRRI